MTVREGSLEAPTRHPVAWRLPDFYDEAKVLAELERIFGICHGCRRCVNLCTAFPTLFDLVDASATLEVDGVQKSQFWKVVDQCYLCDMCYMTKCPYVPPHPWNVDFPHVMLRAKAVKFKKVEVRLRDPLRDRGEGSLLRYAQARARRPRRRRTPEDIQCSATRQARARGLRDSHRGAFVHVDVQERAATAVSGRCRRQGGKRGDVRPV